ncbi:MAG: hypothetical protein ACR2P5_07685 [Gammaproteobacteria bacterium]
MTRDTERRLIGISGVVALALLVVVVVELAAIGVPSHMFVVMAFLALSVLATMWKLVERDQRYYAEREQQAFLAGQRQGKRMGGPKEKVIKFPKIDKERQKQGPAGLYEGSPLGPRL